MEPFTIVRGAAAALPTPNIDTDVIMPKQFLKGVDRKGLDLGVFFDLRFDAKHALQPEFILNQPAWRDARFLVVGPNFGCGSSREHAVWGLSQLGIRGLIGSSFAGIFNDNCYRNGVLTISLPETELATLMQCASDAAANVLTVDLAAQTILIEARGVRIPFAIEPLRKEALLQGHDTISMTLTKHESDIHTFEQGHKASNPWFF